MNFPQHPVYVANFPINMNKSIDGLCALVSGVLGKNPTEPALYVFFNKFYNRVKIFYWEQNGFCVWYKRLEKEKFKVPSASDEIFTLEQRQLDWLLAGLDLSKLKAHKRLEYTIFS